MEDDFWKELHEKPLAPEKLGEWYMERLEEVAKHSPHPYNYCYPNLITWLLCELEWALDWMVTHRKEAHKLNLERYNGARKICKEMLDSIDNSLDFLNYEKKE